MEWDGLVSSKATEWPRRASTMPDHSRRSIATKAELTKRELHSLTTCVLSLHSNHLLPLILNPATPESLRDLQQSHHWLLCPTRRTTCKRYAAPCFSEPIPSQQCLSLLGEEQEAARASSSGQTSLLTRTARFVFFILLFYPRFLSLQSLTCHTRYNHILAFSRSKKTALPRPLCQRAHG